MHFFLRCGKIMQGHRVRTQLPTPSSACVLLRSCPSATALLLPHSPLFLAHTSACRKAKHHRQSNKRYYSFPTSSYQSNMNNQRAPHRLFARHHLTHYTPAPLKPPRAPDSKTRIPPPPPGAPVEQKKKHVPWTKRDDEELEKDTWAWIQWHLNSLEKERTGQIQSFTIVATGEWPEDGPGDGENRRQEGCGAGQQQQQQVASHQEAPQQQASQQGASQQQVPQQQAWPQGAPQQGGWQHGAWQQQPYQQGLWQHGLYQQEPWQQGAWQQGPWQQGAYVQGPWQQGEWGQVPWQQGAWVQGPWQQQQLLAQQAMGVASGVAYRTATSGSVYVLGNDGRYKLRKNLPGKNERRKLRLLSKQWWAA